MSTDPITVAYTDISAEGDRVYWCCVCGEGRSRFAPVSPVHAGTARADSMTPADRCRDCGDALVHDGEGEA